MDYCMHCMQKIMESDLECPFCGGVLDADAPLHHLRPGTVLNKKFLVGKAIGQGGFGITYIGRDLMLDIRIAIKEYYPSGYVSRTNTVQPRVNCNSFGEDAVFFEKGRENFLKEAKILAKFSGEPGIVSVRDFFEENNTAYIVMEYVEGEDLKEYLKLNGKISPELTVKMMLPVMQSLGKIHEQGLVHRDISPDNIRISADGVKLLDFGATRAISATFKKSLSVVLKPGYAPYEQYYSNGEQSAWTDIYSLCATMYHCITGVTPAEAPERLLRDAVKTPSAMGILISPIIEETLMKGLSVKTEDRFATIADLIRSFNGGGTGTVYDGTTLPNPSRHKPEEEDSGGEERESIENRIVSLEPDEEEEIANTGNDRKKEKQGGAKWIFNVLLFVVILALAVLTCLWVLDLRKQVEEINNLLSPTPSPTVATVASTTPGMTETPSATPSATPTERPTPTVPAATKEPTPTATLAPVEFVRNEFTTGIELYPYDGEEEGERRWENSEIMVRIDDIPLALTSGKFYCSMYVPHDSLQNGIYGVEVELMAGYEPIWGSSIVDRALVTKTQEYSALEDGDLYIFSIEYNMQEVVESCYVKFKFNATTRDGNGPVYFNNLYFKDKNLGANYVRFEENDERVSAKHVSGEKWDCGVISGESFWIYGIK